MAMATATRSTIEAERMSLVDTAWLHMEMPTNLMMVGSLAFFDAPLDRDRLVRVLERRLLNHPRFRERIHPAVIGPPSWEVDPLFDLAAHVHRVALPAPGGDAELRLLVADLMSTPLDMTRPLWDVHMIENHGHGSVLLTRIHHAIADGTALVRLLLGLTATTAAASLRAPRTAGAPAPNGAHHHLLAHLDPRRAVGDIVQVSAQAFTLARLTALWPDASTSLRGGLVRAKRVAWTKPFALEDLRPLREEGGYTVNDVLVTAVTGALRSHLRNGGEKLPSHVRALVPVDMRPQDDDGRLGNQFGLVFLDMPVGMPGRRQRLDSVHAMMQLARHSPQPSVAFEVLGALGLVPQAIQRQVVRFFGAKGTAVVTNVRGPARRLYLAGERLVNLTFFVPQSAMLGIGISVMTYAGDIQVGVIADAGLVPEPAAIARDITAELRALVRLGGASGGREDDGE
jgi:WS/DGAT/MGAT family acyltransferase